MSYVTRTACRVRAPTVALTVAMLTTLQAWAGAPTSRGEETAVWSPKTLTFVYQGYTTKYTCDGLQARMKAVVSMLGARAAQVRSYGCTRLGGEPDLFPGVRITMEVLQPAPEKAGQVVTAHWKPVDLLEYRDPSLSAADCEFISQIKDKVLPLFATRKVDYGSTCEKRKVLVGATRLKAEVLTADADARTN
jgi:hypothetical protein